MRDVVIAIIDVFARQTGRNWFVYRDKSGRRRLWVGKP